jgi:tetratricopeptide (TPR) repeat protein
MENGTSIINLVIIIYTLNFDNALYYFNKIKLKKDQIDKASILNNIALTYMEQQEYHKAIQILSHLAQEKEVLNNTTTYSIVLDNLGYCYFKVKSKAFAYLNQSLKNKRK